MQPGPYHLQERTIEHRVLPWCEKRNVSIVAYSPFGDGRFPAPETREGRLLAEIGQAHGATPRQVALRFLVRRPSVLTIPSAPSNPTHAKENAGAGDFQLTKAEITRLDRAFPLGSPERELPVL